MPKFLTLTFRENETSLDEAHKEFTKYIKRLNYHLLGAKEALLKYVAIIEFQERGAIHYHILLFNLPFIDLKTKVLQNTWKFGSSKLVGIKQTKDLTRVIKYLTSYLTKEVTDTRLIGRKRYFRSSGLEKSKTFIREEDVETILLSLPPGSKIYEHEGKSEYLGKIKYTAFRLSGYNAVIDLLQW